MYKSVMKEDAVVKQIVPQAVVPRLHGGAGAFGRARGQEERRYQVLPFGNLFTYKQAPCFAIPDGDS